MSDALRRVVWNGLQAEGHTLGPDADPGLGATRAAYAEVFGSQATLGERKRAALTDMRFYGIPVFCIGPVAENIHGFDERVDLVSAEKLTALLALFAAR